MKNLVENSFAKVARDYGLAPRPQFSALADGGQPFIAEQRVASVPTSSDRPLLPRGRALKVARIAVSGLAAVACSVPMAGAGAPASSETSITRTSDTPPPPTTLSVEPTTTAPTSTPRGSETPTTSASRNTSEAPTSPDTGFERQVRATMETTAEAIIHKRFLDTTHALSDSDMESYNSTEQTATIFVDVLAGTSADISVENARPLYNGRATVRGNEDEQQASNPRQVYVATEYRYPNRDVVQESYELTRTDNAGNWELRETRNGVESIWDSTAPFEPQHEESLREALESMDELAGRLRAGTPFNE